MIEPIIQSERDQRSWDYLLRVAGEDRCRAEIEALTRKPYVSNLAKALGVAIPAEVYTPRPEPVPRNPDIARQEIAKMKALFHK